MKSKTLKYLFAVRKKDKKMTNVDVDICKPIDRFKR